ncbi:OmpA family protein [Flavobacterium sp. F372]|uniref:OmpA family protein n=1 Tax=Flavobacterium bernardetii TaxID=2813823 RepID=A0ABR7IXL9_9FLAO|nr:OmpA family protein [Flavobacterium bernardetii]MBC5834523.1 OmpA family protein [Flavobacterium bernardetii]NHF70171.1 OmpA family protein [Flavobacterium bernardetii]
MKTKNIIILAFLLHGFLVNAQEIKIKKADKNYEQFAYVDAIKTYEKVAEKGFKSVEVFQKLGNAYYFQSKLAEANKWYGELFAMNQEVLPEYYFRYAQTLKSMGDYKKADAMMEKFYEKSGTDNRAKIGKTQKNYLDEIKKNSGRYRIKNAGINSKFSDYGTSFYKNELVFTSARDTGGIVNKKHKWTNQSYTNLYGAKVSDNGNFEAPEKFSSSVSSKYHESTPVFTQDGNTMYFTRNNFNNGKKGRDSERTILLKLFKATKEVDRWTNVTELPFNSNEYSVAHPALSLDEKTLYFASNMPGTIGGSQSDIFKVSINADGSFGIPQNLGDKINTEGRETFPFVTDNNELYFASDGHPGLGGLDIFVTEFKEDGSVGNIKNVGEPVNSNMDDFAFLIDTKSKNGFVSSNRKEDNVGFDDIYKFTEILPIPKDCEQLLTGVVLDLDTQEPIANAKVTLYDADEKKLKEFTSDNSGKYDFGVVECDTTLKIRAEKETYNTNEISIIIPLESGVTDTKIDLELREKPLKPGDDLRKALGIDIIYFDLDKSNIRPDAAVELAKVLEVMKQYPNMKIDVRAHTDCRQTAKYNEVLSDKRAKSVIAWLVKNGIDTNRLSGKGYGESQLINDCGCEPTNKSNCSEEQHQKNRRSEFIILSN